MFLSIMMQAKNHCAQSTMIESSELEIRRETVRNLSENSKGNLVLCARL